VIVVDTSVWVESLRRGRSHEADVLGRLLDADEVLLAAPVRVEILSGASRTDRWRLRRALSALPVLYPSSDTWKLIDGWIDSAGDRGDRFGLGDLLIGALSTEAGALLWSLDADFARMESLRFIRRYEP
jgi:predicted nucleic acid-binding protein